MSGSNNVIIYVLSGALAIAVAAIVVLVLTTGGGNDDTKEARAPVATAAPTAAPAQEPATQAPAAPQAPVTQPLPDRTDCNQIRGTEYLSAAEKAWFEANCLAPTAAPKTPGPAPTTATGGAPAPVDDETVRAYRSRAEATMNTYNARLLQYWRTPGYGGTNDILEMGSIAENYANTLNGISPVPTQFRSAHSRLIGSLIALRDWCRAVQYVENMAQFNAWSWEFDQRTAAVDSAILNLAFVAGITVQPVGGLR